MNASRTTRRDRIGVAIATVLVFSVAACGSKTAAKAPAVTQTPSTMGGRRIADLDPANFDGTSTKIDNRYLPYKPGTLFVYEGSDLVDGERTPHRVEFIVTDLTKVVNGVRTVVIWDRDYSRGVLEEAELTFFAQDKSGNVWHLGQYSEIYEGKELAGARGFLVGYLDGARAGIMMQAHPRPNTPSYSEGYAPPPISWTDRARISQVGQKVKVPAGSYEDVLVTEEYSDKQPDAFQTKYYAPGVGNVRVGFEGADVEGETLQLVSVTQLDADGLVRARAQVMELDARAKMYGSTPPLQEAVRN
jgi:hypothetical protein